MKNVNIKILNNAGSHVEYVIRSNKVIILLDGIPTSKPRLKLISQLAKLGFSVFYPQYLGTKQSQGKFLAKSPITEIDSLINKVKKGVDGKQFTEIFVIATSFGGAVASCIKNQKRVNKIALLSPVLNFKKVSGIATLEKYLKDNHSEDYRFDSRSWKLLLNNKILAPEKSLKISRYKNKYKIFAGKDDPQIDQSYLISTAKKLHIELEVLSDAAHLSFSKINTKTLKSIISWLES